MKSPLVILGAASIACALMATPQLVQADDGASEPEVSYGVGLRLRQMFMPESILELFVEDAPGGGSNTGFGLEFIRQKGALTISLGVEYESLAMEEGIWIDKGDTIPADGVDYVAYDDFSWIAVDASFIWHTNIVGDILSLRYGAGLGIGLLQGDVLQSDRICTGTTVDTCNLPDPAGQADKPADLPPVFPVVNVIVGAQIRPIKSVAINIEGGIRTAPFFGTTLAVMF